MVVLYLLFMIGSSLYDVITMEMDFSLPHTGKPAFVKSAFSCYQHIHFQADILQIMLILSAVCLRDLRGNSFQCNCENKWLMTWLKNTNATVSDVFCAGPIDMKGKRLNDLPIPPDGCISTGKMTSTPSIKKERRKKDQYSC